MVQDFSFFYVVAFAWVMGVTLALFFGYHLSLVYSGYTTNEQSRIYDLQDEYHKDLLQYNSMLIKKKEVLTEDNVRKINSKIEECKRCEEICKNYKCSEGFFSELWKIWNPPVVRKERRSQDKLDNSAPAEEKSIPAQEKAAKKPALQKKND